MYLKLETGEKIHLGEVKRVDFITAFPPLCKINYKNGNSSLVRVTSMSVNRQIKDAKAKEKKRKEDELLAANPRDIRLVSGEIIRLDHIVSNGRNLRLKSGETIVLDRVSDVRMFSPYVCHVVYKDFYQVRVMDTKSSVESQIKDAWAKIVEELSKFDEKARRDEELKRMRGECEKKAEEAYRKLQQSLMRWEDKKRKLKMDAEPKNWIKPFPGNEKKVKEYTKKCTKEDESHFVPYGVGDEFLVKGIKKKVKAVFFHFDRWCLVFNDGTTDIGTFAGPSNKRISKAKIKPGDFVEVHTTGKRGMVIGVSQGLCSGVGHGYRVDGQKEPQPRWNLRLLAFGNAP